MTPEEIEAQSVEVAKVIRIIEAIRPILAGHKPQVQGAVLSELLATWINGHFDLAGRKETKELREAILNAHMSAVKDLMDDIL